MCSGCASVDGDMSGKRMSCQKVLGFEGSPVNYMQTTVHVFLVLAYSSFHGSLFAFVSSLFCSI
jgi:hypothetical protein